MKVIYRYYAMVVFILIVAGCAPVAISINDSKFTSDYYLYRYQSLYYQSNNTSIGRERWVLQIDSSLYFRNMPTRIMVTNNHSVWDNFSYSDWSASNEISFCEQNGNLIKLASFPHPAISYQERREPHKINDFNPVKSKFDSILLHFSNDPLNFKGGYPDDSMTWRKGETFDYFSLGLDSPLEIVSIGEPYFLKRNHNFVYKYDVNTKKPIDTLFSLNWQDTICRIKPNETFKSKSIYNGRKKITLLDKMYNCFEVYFFYYYQNGTQYSRVTRYYTMKGLIPILNITDFEDGRKHVEILKSIESVLSCDCYKEYK